MNSSNTNKKESIGTTGNIDWVEGWVPTANTPRIFGGQATVPSQSLIGSHSFTSFNLSVHTPPSPTVRVTSDGDKEIREPEAST